MIMELITCLIFSVSSGNLYIQAWATQANGRHPDKEPLACEVSEFPFLFGGCQVSEFPFFFWRMSY